MSAWSVYDEDGDYVDGVNAASVPEALAQFSYAGPTWFAIPDRFVLTIPGRIK